MIDIELNTLVYEKPEIDTKFINERTYVDTELDLKLNAIEKGQPSGVASLNPAGTVETTQLPIANFGDTDDETNNSVLMTPEKTHYLINQSPLPDLPTVDGIYNLQVINGTYQWVLV